jgi:Zn-dependent peptidase ImmA (M78 family)/transcriptional regulator with XRE-family HTH domain
MNSFAEMVETLRLARGWTQQQLSAESGLTQAAVSRYENGLRRPDPATVDLLASVFGVTAEFLVHGQRKRAAMAVDAHMRRRASAKPSVWRQLEAQLNTARMHASHLFEDISLHAEQIVPRFDGEDPSAAARMVRMQWRIPVGPIRALTQWIEAAGCVVMETDFGTTRVDGMSQWIDDHPIMLLNSRVPVDRKRWTLAHELGHLVLHSDYVTSDVEVEADEFAAEFLMPSEMIRAALRKPKLGTFIDLKQEWGVSIAALIQRAHSLQTITSTEQTRLFKLLSAKGFRIVEPGSDQLVPEQPQLLDHLRESLENRGLDAEEIARVAGFRGAADNTLMPTPTHHLRVV